MNIVEKFSYIEQNRRSTKPVIEYLLRFDPEELEQIRKDADSLADRLREGLQKLGLPYSDALLNPDPGEADTSRVLGQVFTGVALILQQGAGHRVSVRGSVVEQNAHTIRAYYEYEEPIVGDQAGLLTLQLLGDIMPPLQLAPDLCPGSEELARPLAERLAEFHQSASRKVFPVDAEVLISAARKADIPYFKLDREPFTREPDERLIRPNSTLRLGQASRQHIVDGNFCVDRCAQLRPYLKDQRAIARLLREMDLPAPQYDSEFDNCSSASRVRRSASRIGYPLVMKPANRDHRIGCVTNIDNDSELCRAYEQVSTRSRKVHLERHVAGNTFKIIVAGGRLVGVVQAVGDRHEYRDVTESAHLSIRERVESAARSLETGMFVLTLVTHDVSLPFDEKSFAFVDIDLAPALDSLLPADSRSMLEAAQYFLDWLFPPGQASRIPVVAVTGTNGKSTTSRLIHWVARSAGIRSGLACSDGTYKNGQLISAGDLAGRSGHFEVLGWQDIDFAVLETARGGVAKYGICFDRCHVAICTNVTEDHLEDAGIDTVEQMAELKRSILERATHAVVLNADDLHCSAMIPHLQDRKIFLVSTRNTFKELREIFGDRYGVCCLEAIDGEPWIVLHDEDHRSPIVPTNALPFTFGGKAEFNVSNALCAVAACHLNNVSTAVIGRALSSFETDFDTTPGRLNYYDGREFSILVDYAHNPAGITAFVKLVDQLEVNGRKIVAFSAASYNPDAIVRANAEAAAGHFDDYVCFNFGSNIKRGDTRVPALLRYTLIERGVRADNVVLAEDGFGAIDEIEKLASKGDLVAFLSGHSNRAEIWERLTRTGK